MYCYAKNDFATFVILQYYIYHRVAFGNAVHQGAYKTRLFS